MEPDRQTKIASSLPVFGMLAIIGLAFYVSQRPLESSRPEVPQRLGHAVPEKDKIDARLWQDPLKVALDHEKSMHGKAQTEESISRWECSSEHCVNQVSEGISRLLRKKASAADRGAIIHILLTIVRDGNFAEDHERRLRNRYAVLTALSASGLVPEDSKHIQYFKLRWAEEDELEEDICNSRPLNIPPVPDQSSRTIIVPIEWFKRSKLYPAERRHKCPDHALVVWLPESAFSHRPLTRLAQVVEALGYTNGKSVRIDAVGPSYSDTLLAMLDEIEKITGDQGRRKGCGFDEIHSTLSRLTVFSPWSTASPALLAPAGDANTPKSHDSPSEMFAEITQNFDDVGINFVRMIGSDDLLALELIEELRRRDVDVVGRNDHVVLISEWDTFYGKAFPLIFAAMMKNIDPISHQLNWTRYTAALKSKSFADGNQCLPENLHTYNYIRGIDGKLPESELAGEKKPNDNSESESKWAYAKSLELPIGEGQLDYIRRLAQDLKNEYRGSDKKPKAIGVVGSDVYDKLILLHALREQFGDVILFMTDLDARLLHHEQFKWTRNVIVASNFGLQLNDKYHCDVHQKKRRSLPPFRDNYQTALFFACRVALGLCVGDDHMLFRQMCRDQLTEVISHPRLFEVGRGRAVDISVENADVHPPRHNLVPDPPSSTDKPFSLTRLMQKLARATDKLHLLIDRLSRKTKLLLLLATGSCILLLVQISSAVLRAVTLALPKPRIRALWSLVAKIFKGGTWKLKNLKKWMAETPKKTPKKLSVWTARKTKKILDPRKWNWPRVGLRLATAGVILFAVLVFYDHHQPEGEPFSLFTGVSIWPGEALRLVAAILSIWFIAKSFRDLRFNEGKLCGWFNTDDPEQLRRPALCYRQWFDDKKQRGWSKRLLDPRTMWCYHQERISIHNWSTEAEKRIDAEQLWREFLVRGALGKRVWRTACMSIAYFFLAAALIFLLGGLPHTPYRGGLSRAVDFALLALSGISMIVLIFFVVDATKLSLRFIRNLKVPRTHWSRRAVSDFSRNEGEVPDGLEEWLDIRFIAQLTEAVGKLIYWPFIILLIMFVARNPYFDNWGLPLSLIIIFLLNSTCALCCACMLRHEAEKARGVALDRLRRKLVKATGIGDLPHGKQIEAMIEQVKSVRRGAYSPFTDNPVLHAILIPSGGLSVITLMRFFLPS